MAATDGACGWRNARRPNQGGVPSRECRDSRAQGTSSTIRSFASDGRTLFLEVSGEGGLDIVAIPRDGTGEVSIALAKSIQGVSTRAAEFDPYVSRDGRTLYFSSDRTVDRKIYRATLDTSLSATQLDPLTTLSENGTEQDPVPTVDGTKLYFTRWTDQNPKHAELFVAKKASAGDELERRTA